MGRALVWFGKTLFPNVMCEKFHFHCFRWCAAAVWPLRKQRTIFDASSSRSGIEKWSVRKHLLSIFLLPFARQLLLAGQVLGLQSTIARLLWSFYALSLFCAMGKNTHFVCPLHIYRILWYSSLCLVAQLEFPFAPKVSISNDFDDVHRSIECPLDREIKLNGHFYLARSTVSD